MARQSIPSPEDLPPARKALILAAERMVARYGVAGFTVRMLNAEAGARNASALYYHFGSREDLIRAVWEYRMEAINPRRLELLDGTTPEHVERIVEAIMVPLAEQLAPRAEGNFYLRFLERLAREDAYGPAPYPELPWTEGWRRAYHMLRQGLADRLPAELVELKIRFVRTLVISGLAGLEADIERGDLSPAGLPAMLEVLRDAAVALLGAPPTGRGVHIRD